MSKVSKEDAEKIIESKTIALDRLIKISELIPDPTDRAEINKLIDDISRITQKYLQ